MRSVSAYLWQISSSLCRRLPKDGDWTAFAIAAGIDVAAIAVAAFSAGAGYAAVKGGGAAAKAGVRVAAKEIAEAGAEVVIREAVEAGAKKAIKETAEAGVELAVREAAEAGVETLTREMVEAGVEKAAREVAEEGTEKIAKEATEHGAESLNKVEQMAKNRADGAAREEKVLEELVTKNGKDNVIEQAYLRDKDGIPIKDPVSGEMRRIDFIVTKGKEVIQSIEVTSEKVNKAAQMAKESRILEEAAKRGGAYIKDNCGELIEFTKDILTEIWRLP